MRFEDEAGLITIIVLGMCGIFILGVMVRGTWKYVIKRRPKQ